MNRERMMKEVEFEVDTIDLDDLDRICTEMSRSDELEDLVDVFFKAGNHLAVSYICWRWLSITIKNLQWIPSEDADRVDGKHIEKAKWMAWICYWSARMADNFILAACASKLFKGPKCMTPAWFVWNIETNPDFFFSGSRYSELTKQCLEHGYLRITSKRLMEDGGFYTSYEAGDSVPEMDAPPHPKVIIKGFCETCMGDGCPFCVYTGLHNKSMECPDCDGTGIMPRQNSLFITLEPPNPPCATCNRTGWVLKKDYKR